VGIRALLTKYNRGGGRRTGVPGESNDSTRVTLVRVPARMASALARPGGGRTKGLAHRHGRLVSRTLFRSGMGFWLAPTGVVRGDGSRTGGEVRITLQLTVNLSFQPWCLELWSHSTYGDSTPASRWALDLVPWSRPVLERFSCAIGSSSSITQGLEQVTATLGHRPAIATSRSGCHTSASSGHLRVRRALASMMKETHDRP
jgi:hypothetical protein